MRCNIIFLILTTLLFSCNKEGHVKKRNCSCPLEEYNDLSIKEKIDSFSSVNSITGGPSLTAHIKKILNIEAKASFEHSSIDSSLERINKIAKNDYAGQDANIYLFKMKRLFFCSRYEIMCANTLISDDSLRTEMVMSISNLETLITNHILNDTNSKSVVEKNKKSRINKDAKDINNTLNVNENSKVENIIMGNGNVTINN